MRRLLATLITMTALVASPVPIASAGEHTAVAVCHLTGNGSFHVIHVDEHALDAHTAHGDLRPGDSIPGGDGARLGSDCTVEVVHPAVVASLTGSGLTDTPDGLVTLIVDAYAMSDGTVVGTYYAQLGAEAPISGPVTGFAWDGARAEVCGTAIALGIDTIADLSLDDPSIVDCADGSVTFGPYTASPAGLEGGIDFVLNVYL
jgi:hypothetical protein